MNARTTKRKPIRKSPPTAVGEMAHEYRFDYSKARPNRFAKRLSRTPSEILVLPDPPEPMTAVEIRSLRHKLHASQAVFAHYLNVSPKLVQAWEARRRSPKGPVVLLLRIALKSPRSLVDAFSPTRQRKGRAASSGR